MRDYSGLDRYVDDQMPGWTEELIELCRFPSEADNPEALRGAADWTAARLRRLGADVVVHELDGVPPLVVGTIGQGPTLNAVQHYDVQPAAPLELWTSAPYEPVIRDGRLFARGVRDNKGDLLSRLWGVEAYLTVFGHLPCRVRFLVEGQEENGSADLRRLLDLDPGLRVADGALIEGGGTDDDGRALITGGVRGMALIDLAVRTLPYDAHSGAANLFPGAATRLVRALATLWDDDGVPAVDELRVGTRPRLPAEIELVDGVPERPYESFRSEFGLQRWLGNRTTREAIRVASFETTCNLQAIWSGHTGPIAKTIVPSEARARLDLRLVPDQEPEEILLALRRHLDSRGFEDVETTLAPGSRAYWTRPDHPLLDAAARASEAVTGMPVVRELSLGGTAPMHDVCALHQVPMTTLGIGHEDMHIHAPDENFRLDKLAEAVRLMPRFLDEFSSVA